MAAFGQRKKISRPRALYTLDERFPIAINATVERFEEFVRASPSLKCATPDSAEFTEHRLEAVWLAALSSRHFALIFTTLFEYGPFTSGFSGSGCQLWPFTTNLYSCRPGLRRSVVW